MEVCWRCNGEEMITKPICELCEGQYVHSHCDDTYEVREPCDECCAIPIARLKPDATPFTTLEAARFQASDEVGVVFWDGKFFVLHKESSEWRRCVGIIPKQGEVWTVAGLPDFTFLGMGESFGIEKYYIFASNENGFFVINKDEFFNLKTPTERQ